MVGIGFALHQPLARVPENALKFLVGTMLSAFGTFWIGVGLGVPWPGDDAAMPGLAALIFVASLGTVRILRTAAATAPRG